MLDQEYQAIAKLLNDPQPWSARKQDELTGVLQAVLAKSGQIDLKRIMTSTSQSVGEVMKKLASVWKNVYYKDPITILADSCSLDDEAVEEMIPILQCQPVGCLSLAGNLITPRGLTAIFTGLQEHPQIEVLNLSGNVALQDKDGQLTSKIKTQLQVATLIIGPISIPTISAVAVAPVIFEDKAQDKQELLTTIERCVVAKIPKVSNKAIHLSLSVISSLRQDGTLVLKCQFDQLEYAKGFLAFFGLQKKIQLLKGVDKFIVCLTPREVTSMLSILGCDEQTASSRCAFLLDLSKKEGKSPTVFSTETIIKGLIKNIISQFEGKPSSARHSILHQDLLHALESLVAITTPILSERLKKVDSYGFKFFVVGEASHMVLRIVFCKIGKEGEQEKGISGFLQYFGLATEVKSGVHNSGEKIIDLGREAVESILKRLGYAEEEAQRLCAMLLQKPVKQESAEQEKKYSSASQKDKDAKVTEEPQMTTFPSDDRPGTSAFHNSTEQPQMTTLSSNPHSHSIPTMFAEVPSKIRACCEALSLSGFVISASSPSEKAQRKQEFLTAVEQRVIDEIFGKSNPHQFINPSFSVIPSLKQDGTLVLKCQFDRPTDAEGFIKFFGLQKRIQLSEGSDQCIVCLTPREVTSMLSKLGYDEKTAFCYCVRLLDLPKKEGKNPTVSSTEMIRKKLIQDIISQFKGELSPTLHQDLLHALESLVAITTPILSERLKKVDSYGFKFFVVGEASHMVLRIVFCKIGKEGEQEKGISGFLQYFGLATEVKSGVHNSGEKIIDLGREAVESILKRLGYAEEEAQRLCAMLLQKPVKPVKQERPSSPVPAAFSGASTFRKRLSDASGLDGNVVGEVTESVRPD